MPDFVSHTALQEYGTGDEIALALNQYAGVVLRKFTDRLTIGRHVWIHPIAKGRTYEFPSTAGATSDELERGVVRTGANQPEVERRLVSLNTKQRISDHYESEMDEFIRHFDIRGATGEADADACRQPVERELFAALALGARMAARGTGDDEFKGGYQITDGGSVLATNFPKSLTGSRNLQAHFSSMAQRYDENGLPEEGRIAYLGPYLTEVLLQDKTLLSRDYQDVNNLITRRMVECAGFVIEKAHWLSHTSTAAATCRLGNMSAWSQTAYQGSYLKTIALFQCTMEAVGQITAKAGIRTFGPTWIDNAHSWYYGAKIWHGAKWLRPECCGEIVLT